MVKKSVYIIVLTVAFASCKPPQKEKPTLTTTICNPLDLNYRFQLDEPSRREAADPTMVLFKDTYYLFASKTGGYWYSDDLKDWTYVQTNEIPTEDYAPTAVAIDDTIYFLASGGGCNIYKTADPKTGKWEIAKENFSIGATDPNLFLDDKRLYFYWGCSDIEPIYGIELDYKNGFEPIGERQSLISSKREKYGWEVPGDYNTMADNAPWIEGAWMNKYNGKYYLQYAGPGTQFKSYNDGVYTSNNPLGPFKLEENNPFAFKPEGFACGAGHGSTFEDKYGNFWHIGTVTISQKHMFERRLALYPTFFDTDGQLHADTRFGDYPMTIPLEKIKSKEDIFPNWMLLSYNKPVSVSSELDSFPKENMTNEDIRTYWTAQSGSGEWAIIDLENENDVYAIQLNFAEHNTNILGRQATPYYRYTIEASSDKENWETIADRSKNETDNSHQYIQLASKVNCRYLKITNWEMPSGNFAISGFRVFGLGHGEKPSVVAEVVAERNQDNKRTVHLSWKKSTNAIGYQVRFGINPEKLYQSYMIYNTTSVTINSLNADEPYFFAIEAFNENGASELSSITTVE